MHSERITMKKKKEVETMYMERETLLERNHG